MIWGREGPPALAGLILALALAAALSTPLFDSPYSTVLLDRRGGLLGASLAADEQWRFGPGGPVPEKFAQAAILFEDKRFLSHWGVDPLALGRALMSNFRAGEVVSGGSTLTMQVIRLSRPGRPRVFEEKLIEAVLALRLELSADKQEILRLFASHAPFGGNVVGLEAAAWRYFGRSPEALSWAEAALLAVLPNNPGLIHLGRNRDVLLAKRNRLLNRLHKENLLDRAAWQLALDEPLPPEPLPLPRAAPHLLDLANREKPGQRVVSTIEGALQERVNRILASHHENLNLAGVRNLAALILEVDTGRVAAYAGNMLEEGEGGSNDMILAARSTGSLLKPLLYGSMLDAGELLPSQLVIDIPTRIGGYVPENNTKTYSGALPAWEALAKSLNVPAVRELRRYGVDRFYSQLGKFGMTTLIRSADGYGLTLILGGAEGRLWELTGIYAGVARSAKGTNWKGYGSPPFFAPSYVVQDDVPAGGPAETPLSPGAAFLTLQAMNEVARPGDEGAWKDFSSAQGVAWKTGTSFGYKDAWAIGVTPRYAVGVWVGNADGEGRPKLLGFAVAAPILFDLFNTLPASSWFEPPLDDLREIRVCSISGYPAGPNCDETRSQWIPRDANPIEVCPYHKPLHLDPTGQWQVDSRVIAVDRIKTVNWFVLPPALEYFYKARHLEYRVPPPYLPGAEPEEEGGALSPLNLLFPEHKSRIFIPIELDGTPGKTVFQAAHRSSESTVFWHLDADFLGSTQEIHQMEARPTSGPHTLTLWDETGHSIRRTFTILSH